jgi:hypothetical protein
MPDNNPQAQFDMKATLDELTRFEQSSVFQDFALILRMRLQVVQGEMENMSLGIDDIRYRQGEIAGLKYWLTLPKRIVETRTEEEKKQGEQR